ncbi:sucrose phosphorylase [Diaminobutyricimonas aerilata]|uniref:Sucrose phosphorylase n=1 Tax=Diaminobutyricimonas aerilata TaxID=1162967 RepID=A0A2M9CLU7_9MICO|nr:sucrose phosphorylase [Diaminobutyricimonas aerilata]PJJ72864.1 sucrose phosphorylase [Diaminobutyricimonas aerilata]
MTTRGVSLLAYADRFGGGMTGLRDLLDGPLAEFAGVHILPFFVPFDGADAGFDPIDHATVDPRLGDWDDVRAIAARREVTADLIVNHVSASSGEFRDWLADGEASEHHGMFLTFDTVFPNGGTEREITAFYRPRPGLPFTSYQSPDGTRRLVWTTFMPSQVDLDVAHPAAHAYLRRVLAALADGGVTTVRLDAVGYAVKTPGSDSFMTEHTLGFVREITAMVREYGMRVLVEVHAHYTQQQAIAPLVDLVYDFALPPLLLHSLGTGTIDRLIRWLEIRPRNAVTVLDTHDGIGVIDAGPSGDRPGLLSTEEMAAIFDRAAAATDGHSSIASVIPAWAPMPHQINATFFSVLEADAGSYLLARAVQFFVPGEPQVYYVGLLAGLDDVELFRRTGQGRDVNRHVYTRDEIDAALAGEVPRALLDLVRLRSAHPAFEGAFSVRAVSATELELAWTAGEHHAVLHADLAARTHRIDATPIPRVE